jgi:membrane-associated protease RseP (regulator of RpoE activity)
VTTPENPTLPVPTVPGWHAYPSDPTKYVPVIERPSNKSLVLAIVMFFLTLCTSLVAGTQFAISFANNQAASVDEFLHDFTFLYKHPSSLIAGLPFALTLLTILLAHELGHFFACRHHHIRASYPFFIPFPSFIGTFGAVILMRSRIRTNRALFDVGASGPLVGFVFAVPALLYGVIHSKAVLGLSDPAHADVLFGTPLLLRFLHAVFHPGVDPGLLLLPPIGRAAWVGLFATALNLLPTAQLDGGHILRSISPKAHRMFTMFLPFALAILGFVAQWQGWYIWAALLFAIRFLRISPVYDPIALDPSRRLLAMAALIILVLTFMPAPIIQLVSNAPR